MNGFLRRAGQRAGTHGLTGAFPQRLSVGDAGRQRRRRGIPAAGGVGHLHAGTAHTGRFARGILGKDAARTHRNIHLLQAGGQQRIRRTLCICVRFDLDAA